MGAPALTVDEIVAAAAVVLAAEVGRPIATGAAAVATMAGGA